MTSRGLGIRGFSAVFRLFIDQRDGRGQVSIKAGSAAAVAPSFLFLFFGRRALLSAQRVERFENEATVIAEEFLHADHPEKKDGIIVIPLNPLTLAPRAPHRSILTGFEDTLGL